MLLRMATLPGATQATLVQLIQLHRCRLSGYTCVSALATLHEFVQATFL